MEDPLPPSSTGLLPDRALLHLPPTRHSRLASTTFCGVGWRNFRQTATQAARSLSSRWKLPCTVLKRRPLRRHLDPTNVFFTLWRGGGVWVGVWAAARTALSWF